MSTKFIKKIITKLIFRNNIPLIITFIVLVIIFYSPYLAANSIVFGYGGGGGGGGIIPSSTKAITAFIIPGQVGASAINESAKTIALTMPYGTNITSLVPTIIITGAKVSPASGVARGFATPETYTVTAADGSTQNYTVTVDIAPAIPTAVGETDWFIKNVKRTDIVRDGKIDILDFNALMVNWGKKSADNPADANQDGLVDIYDFNLLMVHWGKTES